MQSLRSVIYVASLILTVFISVVYRLFFFWRVGNRDCKRVLNYGADLYALACKGNLNHAWNLINPLRVFEKVFTVCSDPRSLQLDLKEEWLVPVLVSRWPWLRILRLFHLCQRERIGLFRGREPNMAAFIGLCLKIALRIPMILSTGGDHRLSQDLQGKYAFGSRRVAFLVEEMAYRYADLIFCINQYTRKLIENLGGGKRNILVENPIRIDGDVFDYRKYEGVSFKAKEGMDEATKVVLYVGRLEYDKQVDIFFDAIRVVLSEFTTALFYVLGDGLLRRPLEERVNQEGILESVVFKGFMSNEELPYYYSMADVVCIPMSGFVIYEAAAMQRPIVAFDVDWHAEFVENGVTGLLIPNRDVKKLAGGILSLLRDDKLAMQLAQNARKKFIEKYEPQRLVKREASIIEDFCQRLKCRTT